VADRDLVSIDRELRTVAGRHGELVANMSEGLSEYQVWLWWLRAYDVPPREAALTLGLDPSEKTRKKISEDARYLMSQLRTKLARSAMTLSAWPAPEVVVLERDSRAALWVSAARGPTSILVTDLFSTERSPRILQRQRPDPSALRPFYSTSHAGRRGEHRLRRFVHGLVPGLGCRNEPPHRAGENVIIH